MARRITLTQGGWFLSIRNDLLGPFASVYVAREASEKLNARLAGVVDERTGEAVILVLAFEYGIRPPNDPSRPRRRAQSDDDPVSIAAD